MSGSVNRATILGHLGRDPETRTTNAGTKVVTMSVATSETWKDRNSGEKRERTEWHRIVIFNETLCGIAEKYLRKGSKCLIEGQIQTRKWQDQGGADRYSTEIVLQAFDAKLVLLDKQSDPGRNDFSAHEREGARGGARGGGSAGGGSGGGNAPIDDLDDDVPF